jgi:hypothetical protein
MLRVTLCSVLLALAISFGISLYIYIAQGMITLTNEVISAFFDVMWFWFGIAWSFTLLLALFRSIKYIFNRCFGGYSFRLLECVKDKTKKILKDVGYGDLIKVWRRWFMLLIWLVGSEMVLSLAFTNIFTNYNSLFEWFNIYVLFLFLLSSGYISFIMMSSRCKQIKIVKC